MGLNLLPRVRAISRLLEQRGNDHGCSARGNKVKQPTRHAPAAPRQADQQRNTLLFENARDRRGTKQPIGLRLIFSLMQVRLTRLPDLVILTIFAAATLLYARGVFLGLSNWAGRDWDQHLLYS